MGVNENWGIKNENGCEILSWLSWKLFLLCTDYRISLIRVNLLKHLELGLFTFL